MLNEDKLKTELVEEARVQRLPSFALMTVQIPLNLYDRLEYAAFIEQASAQEFVLKLVSEGMARRVYEGGEVPF